MKGAMRGAARPNFAPLDFRTILRTSKNRELRIHCDLQCKRDVLKQRSQGIARSTSNFQKAMRGASVGRGIYFEPCAVRARLHRATIKRQRQYVLARSPTRP